MTERTFDLEASLSVCGIEYGSGEKLKSLRQRGCGRSVEQECGAWNWVGKAGQRRM